MLIKCSCLIRCFSLTNKLTYLNFNKKLIFFTLNWGMLLHVHYKSATAHVTALLYCGPIKNVYFTELMFVVVWLSPYELIISNNKYQFFLSTFLDISSSLYLVFIYCSSTGFTADKSFRNSPKLNQHVHWPMTQLLSHDGSPPESIYWWVRCNASLY